MLHCVFRLLHVSVCNLFYVLVCDTVCRVSQVVVGNLEYELGELEYQQPVNQGNELWIIGVALGGGILITIIIVILIIYKRKSTYAERQFKKMQIQLDTLESNVRNECKQGESD